MSTHKHLHKAEDPSAYKKMAAEGIMLAHPVTIQGQNTRPDTGTHFHSSIKVFDKDKDHPHAIHDLAQHLPLNPPDAKNTQIEPGQFKDRFGNDVFVIKLHGNSAEKMKEHNGKFAHMGTPTSYEFQPHVSVPKDIHDKIKASGAKTAHEAGIQFGNAELKQGPTTLKTYHHKPDTTEPVVPDESDFTAKAKTPVIKSEALDKSAFTAPDPKKPGVSEIGVNVRSLKELKNPKARVEATKRIREGMSNVKKPPNKVLTDWEDLTSGAIKDAYKATKENRDNAPPKKLGSGIPEPESVRGTDEIKLAASEQIHGQKPLMKPYVSEAQRRWAHTPTGKEALGGNAGVHEWDEATKGKKLPEKVSKEESLEKGALKNAAIGGLMGLSGLASLPAHADYNHVDSYLNSMKGKVPGVHVDTQKTPGMSHGKLSVGKFHVHTKAMLGGKSPISNHEVTLTGPKKETWNPQDSQDYENAKFLHQHLTDVMPKLMQMTGPVKKSELNDLQKGALKNAALGAGMLASTMGGSQAQAAPKVPSTPIKQTTQQVAVAPVAPVAPAAPAKQAIHQSTPKSTPTVRAPSSIQHKKPHVEPYNHKKMLQAIAQVESSNNSNAKHEILTHGIDKGTRAYGKYGLTNSFIHDVVKAHPDLRTKHHKIMALKGDQLNRYMADHPGLEDTIAERGLSHREHRLGKNPDHLSYSWLNGVQGTLRDRNAGQDIQNHWHVSKVRNAYKGIK